MLGLHMLTLIIFLILCSDIMKFKEMAAGVLCMRYWFSPCHVSTISQLCYWYW